MRRREFLGSVSAAVAWPAAAWSQQDERVRRIGVLMHTHPDDRDSQARLTALQQGLRQAGWSVGGDLRVDLSWSGGNAAQLRKGAFDLVALGADLLVAGVGPTAQALQNASRSIPIVMTQVVDPVGAGVVSSLSRPRGNTTGFMQFEYGLSAKWLELLKELAPQVRRVGVVRDHETGTGSVVGTGQWAVIQAFAPSLGAELSAINFRSTGDVERDIADFSREAHGGLIIVVGASVATHYEQIIALASRHRMPAVYPYRFYVEAGGLASYGPDLIDLYRRAAGYIDRILKGDKPGDLPVQAPTKYQLAINLKTAKALGIAVPSTLLARADEVIE